MKLIIFLLPLACSAIAGTSPQNWNGEYPPCNRHSDLLKRDHVDLGVRISTSNKVLAREFARAMNFWAGVIDIEWHEADSEDCSIELVDGMADLFDSAAVAARSQFPDRPAFEGWVAFNPGSKLTGRDMFLVSVHEIGHLLGLPHNPSAGSVMFFLQLDDPVVLDTADLDALAGRHKLRTGILEKGGSTAARVTVPSE